MGQILFWLEAAAAGVLLAALRTTINARINRWQWRWLVGLGYLVVMFLFWLATAGITIVAHAFARTSGLPLIGAVLGLAGFLAGSIVVRIRGRRKNADEPTRRVAADWPAARLAWAALAAAILTGMTFWNLDLAARQEMAVIHAEACMTAMSVTPPRVSDSQNAAPLYRRAGELMKADPGWQELVDQWLHPSAGGFNPTDEKMLAFLARHADSLDLLRQGADLPGYDDGLPFNLRRWQMELPPLEPFQLREYLHLSAKVNAQAGRTVEAARDIGAIFGMARHKSTEPLEISVIFGMTLERDAFEAFQDLLDAGPVPLEALDALGLDPRTAFQPAMQRATVMEECFGIGMFSEIPAKNATVDDLRKTTRFTVFTFCENPLYRVFLWRGDLDAYRGVMDPVKQLAGRPYHESAEAWKRLRENPVHDRMGGMLARLIAPVTASFAPNVAQADAHHRLSLLAVAACRYHHARGAGPETLAALVPAYLPAVPADPFTGKPLLLAHAPDGRPILYSVGRDMTDDGGKPFDRQTEKGDIRLVLPAK
ncbi:MAG: hypothetical protein NT031_14055 [Planctomycetota bacterium]|nr:hypothetical protein [Planctomycetota bacterium]